MSRAQLASNVADRDMTAMHRSRLGDDGPATPSEEHAARRAGAPEPSIRGVGPAGHAR